MHCLGVLPALQPIQRVFEVIDGEIRLPHNLVKAPQVIIVVREHLVTCKKQLKQIKHSTIITSYLHHTVQHLDTLPVIPVQGLYVAPHKLAGLAQGPW